MKISNSSIMMESAHHESSVSYKETMTIEAAKSSDAAGAILTLSKEGHASSVKEAMVQYQEQQKKNSQNSLAENLKHKIDEMRKQREEPLIPQNSEYDAQVKMLRKILAALRGEKLPADKKPEASADGKLVDFRSESFKKLEGMSISLNKENVVNLGNLELGTRGSGTTWQRITATSGFYGETESMSFASQGIVNTADGRSINFNVELHMSRGFYSQIDKLETAEYIKTDPLMINLDTNIPSVSDQKFYFDLDSDGKEEKISFAGKGSGFLALDKNGDGKINDGSELFGTKSGDGFKDLAAYDEDGNGWIDENDSVFKDLKVWTKDDKGNDILMDLKKADVGAIYLGNADTQFSLKDETNALNAEIRKTGIYLKESTGAAYTLNHVDLVV